MINTENIESLLDSIQQCKSKIREIDEQIEVNPGDPSVNYESLYVQQFNLYIDISKLAFQVEQELENLSKDEGNIFLVNRFAKQLNNLVAEEVAFVII